MSQTLHLQQAVEAIRQHTQQTYRAGLVLGSGLGSVADAIDVEVEIPYQDIPHFPTSTALAHKGILISGTLGGVPIVALSGRCHLYEGYHADDVALPIRTMHQLGARLLIVSNASGAVNPHLTCGDILVIEDHINLMWQTVTTEVTTAPAHFRSQSQTPLYDPELIERSLQIARQQGFSAQQGVYIGVSGPTYETRAEYRFFRTLGDTVGMSTIPEVVTANHCGMRVLALSVITNVAQPDAPQSVSAEEVVDVANEAAPRLASIVQHILRRECDGQAAEKMPGKGPLRGM